MNSAFCMRFLAGSLVNSTCYSPPSSRRGKIVRQEFYFPTIFWYIERNKLFFGIYTCVVYVKTVIHLSIDESGGIFTEWRGGEVNFHRC